MATQFADPPPFDHPTIAGRPRPSVQEVLAADRNPASAILRSESPAQGLPTDDVSIDRYISADWARREIDAVWRKTWQLACRVEEIPNPGDHVVYDIVDDSLIVARGQDGRIRAFVNSCLHRGTQLRAEGGCVKQLVCPFHAFTWNLDGSFAGMPGAWDFPHLDRANFNLPQAQVGVWGGFVFINFDAACEPLETYLENLPEHFAGFALEDRWKAAHVAKLMPCNWKLALEAFIEAYHVSSAHPQVMGYYGDENTQYDVWPGVRHTSRMISVQGVPSPARADTGGDETIRQMRRDVPFFAGEPIVHGDGVSPRAALAERARAKIGKASKRDMSALSDCESLDLIEYLLFPNMVPWGGQSLPLVYRFRPNGHDPDSCIMEIMYLFAKAPDGSHPPPARITWLGLDAKWADAPELGSAAKVADQDTSNLRRIQRGLKASRKPGVTLAQYQESRIRHFHMTLDAYMAAGDVA